MLAMFYPGPIENVVRMVGAFSRRLDPGTGGGLRMGEDAD